MIAEIISVGTELLLGNIVNTNAQYIAKRLANLGIEVHFQTVVGDNADRIRSVLDIAYSRGSMVILTGGLGPTKDDMTKEMLLSYFHKTPVLDRKVIDMLEERLKTVGITEMSEGLRKQAIVPADSLIFYNNHGTAPGCVMEDEGKIAILLPGPPKEMKPMFEDCVEQYLSKLSDRVFVSVNINMLDFDHAPVAIVGESPVADRLDTILDSVNPTVATYAREKSCFVRVTASAHTKEEAYELLGPMIEKCKEILGEEYIESVKEEE